MVIFPVEILTAYYLVPVSDRTGSKFLAQVGSAIFGLGLRLENFSLKSQIFQFFSLWLNKISLGRVKKYLGQRWVGLLFTAGQKYARVGLGPISSTNVLPSIKNPSPQVATKMKKVKRWCPSIFENEENSRKNPSIFSLL